MQDTRNIELAIICYLINTQDGEVLSELKADYFTSLDRAKAISCILENPTSTILEVNAKSRLPISEITYGSLYLPANSLEAFRYVDILKENHIKHKLAQMSVDPDDESSHTIVRLQQELEDLSRQTKSPTGSMVEAKKEALQLKNDNKRYSFSLPSLDQLLQFRRGGVYVIGGRPASGKSYLALQFALVQALSMIPTLFISTELSKGANYLRLKSMYMGLDRNVDGDIADEILSELSTLYLHDTIVTIDNILHEARKSVVKNKIQVIVIDHIQEISNDKGSDELKAFEDVLTKLRLLAMDKNLCIVLASQLNKEGQFKGASKIQEVSAGSIVLTRDGDEISIEITKNRNGQRPKDPVITRQEWPYGLFMEVDNKGFGKYYE